MRRSLEATSTEDAVFVGGGTTCAGRRPWRGGLWGPLRPLRGHLPLKGEGIVVLT